MMNIITKAGWHERPRERGGRRDNRMVNTDGDGFACSGQGIDGERCYQAPHRISTRNENI